MKSPSLLAIACVLSFLVGAAQAQSRLVSVRASEPSDRVALAAARLDVLTATDEPLVLLHGPADAARLAATNLPWTLIESDLQASYAARLAGSDGRPESGGGGGVAFVGSLGGFPTWTESTAFMEALEQSAPHLVAPATIIGTSFEGRPIRAWKISDNPLQDETEPEIVVDAMHHGREPMSLLAALHFADWLVNGHGSDPRATALVDHREIWIVPCINPDGYVHNQVTDPSGGGLWRKNRRPLPGGAIGVDPNRNYGHLWGFDDLGSSPVPSDATYRGPAPFSEPCTAAYRDFLRARNPSGVISLHAFGNVIGIPPGHAFGARPGAGILPLYERLMDRLRAAVPGHGVSWTPEVLWLANGTSTDWVAGSLRGGDRSFSAVLEIGDSSDGFWPPASRHGALAAEACDAIAVFAESCGPDPRVESVTMLEPSGNLARAWEPGESLDLQVVLRNDGLLPAFDVDVDLLAPWLTGTPTPTARLSTIAPGGAIASQALVLPFEAPSAMLPGSWAEVALRIHSDQIAPRDRSISRALSAAEQTVTGTSFEVATGWTAGAPGDTATTPSDGVWTRGTPVGTIRPGAGAWHPAEDATPGNGTQCWSTGIGPVGGSHTSHDVDGITTLNSPRYDLSGFTTFVVEYARWFATTGFDDVLTIEITNDGGARWHVLEEVRAHAPRWARRQFFLDGIVAPTDKIRLRVRVEDGGTGGAVEAAFDDFRIRGVMNPLQLDIARPAPDRAQISLCAPSFAGIGYVLAASFGVDRGFPTGAGTVPLVQDLLFQASVLSAPLLPGFVGTLDTSGEASVGITVPVGLPTTIDVWVCGAITGPQGLIACSGGRAITLQ